MGKTVIELQNIKRDFIVGDETVHALRGVSFSIEEGEFVTIMGTSGSGKSTLLNTLGCLDTPSSGEYYLDGISVRKMSKPERAILRNRKIGFVFQNYNLLPKTTAVENVELPLMYNPAVGASERRERAIKALQVTDVLIWDVEQSGENAFTVTYEVDQQIKEGDQTRDISETYTVTVHVDADGDMVVIQNPTLAPAMEKSDYEPKAQEADNSVDGDTVNDATTFLETFFKLYPTATDKELAYYVEGNALEPINGDYLFSELVNPVFTVDGDNVKVSVAVKFIDNQTKATQISQYELTLHKDSNWKILG